MIGRYSAPRYSLSDRLRHIGLRAYLWAVKKAGADMESGWRVYSAPAVLLRGDLETINREHRGSRQRAAFAPFFDRVDKYDADIGTAVDDLHDLMDWMRQDGNYAHSDRLRSIMGRLARARRNEPDAGQSSYRQIARGYK